MGPYEEELVRYILIVIAAFLIVLVIFVIAVLRQQREYHKVNKQKIKAEITTLENERKRIAADLHDEIGPLLSAVKLRINNIALPDKESDAMIKASSNYMDEIIARMREISNGLLPNVLIRKGLSPAIEEFVRKVDSSNGLKIDYQHNDNIRYSNDIEVNMYRIVQEIIHNTIKHAQATKLTIKLKMLPNSIVLSTDDNGVGFQKRSDDKGGLGLLNLQSRTDVMNGEMWQKSIPGKGTTYYFEILNI